MMRTTLLLWSRRTITTAPTDRLPLSAGSRFAAATAALSLALCASPTLAQLVVAQPVIDQHPQAATVLSGEGAAFSVVARAAGGGIITRIEWRDGSGRVVQSGADSSLSRNAWAVADAGDYTATVHHSNGTSVTSRPARLTVRTSGWAPVGGRALPWPASARVPALEWCGGPIVAWVEMAAAGNREVRVHRFDGVRWRALGNGSLLAAPTNSPNEPSLQCLPFNQSPVPVLAFSETWAGGGRIAVQRWDGQAWITSGQVHSSSGAAPRAPVLGVKRIATTTVPRNSWLAWQEGSLLRAAAMGAFGEWQELSGWWLTEPIFGSPVLALDNATVYPDGHSWLPLLAAIEVGAKGSRPRVLQYKAWGWVDLGRPPAEPVKNGLRAVGMAFANEPGGKRAVLVWSEGGSHYTLRSASLAGADYEAALHSSTDWDRPWGAYAADYLGTDLQATAFDAQPFDRGCGAAGPLSFTTALASSTAVTVLQSRCGALGQQPQWMALAPPLPAQALGLALRVIHPDTPLLAVVGPTGFGGYALTVWKYRP